MYLNQSFTEYGLGGIMQPMMSFEKGFCNYDCTVCSHTCPNGAILPLTKEEKHLTQMGRVVFTMENCIVYNDETDCGACSEHCPTQAVKMVDYKDGLTIPSVNPDICVGCGGCEYVCPATPFKAINVEGNVVQLKAKPFKDENNKDVKVDSFGF
jgi:MinD superfamily P-loop ATPase containing an inserted ferredoxin domain